MHPATTSRARSRWSWPASPSRHTVSTSPEKDRRPSGCLSTHPTHRNGRRRSGSSRRLSASKAARSGSRMSASLREWTSCASFLSSQEDLTDTDLQHVRDGLPLLVPVRVAYARALLDAPAYHLPNARHAHDPFRRSQSSPARLTVSILPPFPNALLPRAPNPRPPLPAR